MYRACLALVLTGCKAGIWGIDSSRLRRLYADWAQCVGNVSRSGAEAPRRLPRTCRAKRARAAAQHVASACANTITTAHRDTNPKAEPGDKSIQIIY